MEKQQPHIPTELTSPQESTHTVPAASWAAEQFPKLQLAQKLQP